MVMLSNQMVSTWECRTLVIDGCNNILTLPESSDLKRQCWAIF